MSFSSNDTLSELLDELKTEYDKVQIQIDDLEDKVKEIDLYIESISKTEDEDLKIFSPRDIRNVNHDKIEKADFDREGYLSSLKKLYHSRNQIQEKIDKLNQVAREGNSFHVKSEATNPNLDILELQENDRQRIARELHDTSLQDLSHLVHRIELASMFIDQDVIRAKLELSLVQKELREVIDDIRNTIFDLRPMTFDDLGFKASVERLIDVVRETNTFKFELDLEEIEIDNNIFLVSLYRAISECLNNIVKHAKADSVFVSCKSDNEFCTTVIRDNGVGFNQFDISGDTDRHFGIKVMEERINLIGGTILIDSKINEGTCVTIKIPLDSK